MPKLFITGSTGYIGGDALHAIVAAHPEYDITALVRSSGKGAKVASEFPQTTLVYGDLNDSDLVTREAEKADIVLCCSDDHESSMRAIVEGLSSRHASRGPAFLIYTSGTGSLILDDLKAQRFGEAFSDKIYDDLEGVHEVTSLPEGAPHRKIDRIVLEAGTVQKDKIKTAIVSPPTIYGQGRGPDGKRSLQVPKLCRATLEKGHGIKVNQGKAYWGNVHIHDLSNMFVKLVEVAAAGGSTAEWPGKPETWGAEGYYFCETGELVWGDVSQWVADEAFQQGLITSKDVVSLTAEETNSLESWGAALWGTNSRSRAKRGAAILKWEPVGPSLRDEIKAAIETEAKALGLKPGHAEVAAGTK